MGESVTVEIFPGEKRGLDIGVSSVLGTRSNQEDTVFAYASGKRALAVVCDGMGGLEGGELASKTAAESLAEAWFEHEDIEDIPEFLKKQALEADEKVFSQKNESGESIEAGTTIAAVIVRENELYWLSVGDSKIYIIRGEEILSVCQEHNYRMVLDERLGRGEITPEDYAAQEYKAGALVSYLGMGNLSLMDVNRRPFFLEDHDIVLLCSDGLYRSLTEKKILSLVRQNRESMKEAAKALTRAALEEKRQGQDNTSVVVLRYCKKGTEECE